MIRLLLVIAVIALGADAVMNDGAYTQAAWQKLQTLEITANRDASPRPENRS
jgi:hypothetical protein